MRDNALLELEFLFRDEVLYGAYVRLHDGKITETTEVVPDVLLADYDKHGELVGIDILAPVDIKMVIELVHDTHTRKRLASVMQNRIGDLLQTAA